MQHYGPPRISAKELRPGRHWYVTAAVIAVVLIGLGVASGVYQVKRAMDAVNTDGQFASGESTTVRMEADSAKGIFVARSGTTPADCDVTGPADASLSHPSGDYTFSVGGTTWELLFSLRAPQAGEYEVTCEAEEQTRFAVGDDTGVAAFLGGIALAVALPLVGIAICVTIVVITAVRRNGHRKRLLAERYGYGYGYGPYPGPGPGSGPGWQ